jgi:hypothetical protein
MKSKERAVFTFSAVKNLKFQVCSSIRPGVPLTFSPQNISPQINNWKKGKYTWAWTYSTKWYLFTILRPRKEVPWINSHTPLRAVSLELLSSHYSVLPSIHSFPLFIPFELLRSPLKRTSLYSFPSICYAPLYSVLPYIPLELLSSPLQRTFLYSTRTVTLHFTAYFPIFHWSC